MDGGQIEYLLKSKDSQNLISSIFARTVCIDEFPENPEINKLYLVNTSFSYEEVGEHWIICYYRYCEWMRDDKQWTNCHTGILDSLANDPVTNYPQIYRILSKNGEPVFSFSRSVQWEISSSCSLYCLLYSWYMSRLWSPREILSTLFPPIPKELQFLNDVRTAAIVETVFKLKDSQKFIFHLPFLLEREEYDSHEQRKKKKMKKNFKTKVLRKRKADQ